MLINETALWVTGGSPESPGSEYTSEIFTLDNPKWENFVQFPTIKEQKNCILQLNSTHYFMSGGHKHGFDVYIVDISEPKYENKVHQKQKSITSKTFWKSESHAGRIEEPSDNF